MSSDHVPFAADRLDGLVQRGERRAGVGFVLLSALAFASTPALVTLSYRAQLNAVSLVGLRCIIGAVVLLMLAARRHEARIDRPTSVRLLLLGGVLFGPQMLLYFTALRYLDTGVGSALVYTYPALVLALVAARERRLPSMSVGVLLVVALLGVTAVTTGHGAGPVSVVGIALALGTALLYAGYVLVSETVLKVVPPLRASAIVLVGAGLSSLAAGLITGAFEVPKGTAAWSLLAAHGLLVIPVGMAAYYAGLRRLGATQASIIDTAQPALVALIGVAFLSESLGVTQGVGVALILTAVVCLPARRRARDGRSLSRRPRRLAQR